MAHTSLGPGADVHVVIGDILQQQITASTTDQAGIVSWFWRVTEVFNEGAVLGDIAEAMDTVWAQPTKALMSAGAEYRGMRLTKVFPKPPSAFCYNNTSRGPGAVAGDILPKQVAGVITWYTNKGGQAYRGRSYWPFPSETDSDPTGAPTQSYVTRLIDPALSRVQSRTFIGAAGSVVLTPIIFHRELGTSDPLLSGQVRGRWGTQRRRGDYGQHNVIPF